MDGFSKTGCKTRKIFPFDPECTTYMYLTLGRALFFAKKERKRNAMKSLRKVLFSFLISKCIDSFCHECRIPRWKKNPKEKLNGSLRVEKQKNKKKFYFHFFKLLSFSLYLWSNINHYLSFLKTFAPPIKNEDVLAKLTQCWDKIWNFVLTL